MIKQVLVGRTLKHLIKVHSFYTFLIEAFCYLLSNISSKVANSLGIVLFLPVYIRPISEVPYLYERLLVPLVVIFSSIFIGHNRTERKYV